MILLYTKFMMKLTKKKKKRKKKYDFLYIS